MRILGLHDGHTSTACYLENGRVRTVVSEERLSGRKGQGGFPARAVALICRQHGISAADFDGVALAGLLPPLVSPDQYRQGRQRIFPHLVRFFPGNPRHLISRVVKLTARRRLGNRGLRRELRQAGLRPGQVVPVEHHQTHAECAYHLSPGHLRGHPVLVITLDGSGDGLCGSVSLVDPRGRWRRLRTISSFDSIGMVYSRVTQYLAMKPWEHEYKLMGMAPYASPTAAGKVKRYLEGTLGLSADGLGFENRSRRWGNSYLAMLRRDLAQVRFDAVAAGVQLLFEELVTEWVGNWIRRTGVGRLAVGGGCFMNVKANQRIIEQTDCTEMFVMPSGGDESCAMGAAIARHRQLDSPGRLPIAPLTHLYLGPVFGPADIQAALGRFAGRVRWRVCEDIELETARLLADQRIVGRLSGPMEWGARALGNRSILANPSRLQNIRRINAAVKMRDFWMPFAPSIRWERRRDYARLPKDHASCHMTLACESTALAREHLIAALHPYDLTMRPQFVRSEDNPGYHRLLRAFEKLTGIGGVLNTSFNRHGFPIVCTPDDAIETLLHSQLDCITLDRHLVWKTGAPPV